MREGIRGRTLLTLHLKSFIQLKNQQQTNIYELFFLILLGRNKRIYAQRSTT